ncbi:MAG: DHH family phosphoesterase [Anaerolineales bacterium]|nr:DHH family phosphoesterase [Anaerolineales bacterium]
MSRTYVVGHVNPDTDAIASAMGYAWFRNAKGDGEVVAARAGPINVQTAWVLDRLELSPPEFLADASPRFEVVVHRYDTVTPDQTLRDAWTIANRTGTVAPVVDSNGMPFGLISGFSLFRSLSKLVGPRLDFQDIRLQELFDQPCREVADTEVPKFLSSSRIREGLPRVLREERNDFWVVDQEGRYVGVCRQRDLLNPPRLQIILVDHNEVSQSIRSLDEADLLEVLDHHRVNNPPTRLPIRFRVDPVGSTSTLVSERIEDNGMSAPPAIAGLLLAGVVSDTLRLNSPTTTERDHRACERLGRWAFVGGSPLENETADSFGEAVLKAAAGLASREPEDVVSSDLKVYESAGLKFGIAQAEVTDHHEVDEHLPRLNEALDNLIDVRSLSFALLMVTDIVEGSSRIVIRRAPALLYELPYERLPDETYEARGVVSRKKQLVPVILALLEG